MRRTAVSMTIAAAAGLASACLAQTGPSTLQSPYVIPSSATSGVQVISIASNGNGTLTPNETHLNLRTGTNDYRLVGIPDGLGAYVRSDDPAGTFRITCNHEIGDTTGIVRAHGNRGSFVSEWLIRASDLAVLGARDLVTATYLWNSSTTSYTLHNSANPMPAGFGRLCSADMPAPSALRFGALGTDARMHLNGEEVGAEGRAFAHIVTGPLEGTAWHLPWLGKFSWENCVASPFPQQKTIIMGADDSTPGNIYFYVGTKTNTGNDLERAGLTNGITYAVGIAGTTVTGGQNIEDRVNILGNSVSGPVSTKPFTLINLGDISGMTGAQLQSAGDTAGQMNFLRPEDAAWDPSNPRRCYFVTTDSFGNVANPGRSRIWAMDFTDILQPQLGGVITMLGDGGDPSSFAGGIISPTGLTDVKMMDNFCVTRFGQLVIQEDVGNNPRLGRQ